MQRFSKASVLSIVGILTCIVFWTACGGDNNETIIVPVASLVPNQTVISLQNGQVASLSITPKDASGNTLSASVTFTSSSPADSTDPVLSVSSPGVTTMVCAGQWRDSNTVCQPSRAANETDLVETITATVDDVTVQVPVYIHRQVDRLEISTIGSGCTSSGDDLVVTATAYNETNPNCTETRCQVGVGAFSFVVDNPVVGTFGAATLDATQPVRGSVGKATITARAPGITTIHAVAGNTTGGTTASASATFTTCLVESIKLHLPSPTPTPVPSPTASPTPTATPFEPTRFTVTTSSSQTLLVDVRDTLGTQINPTLNFNNTQPVSGTVTATSNQPVTFTGKTAPGYGTIIASCSPPNCNVGLDVPTQFSNVVSYKVIDNLAANVVTPNATNVWVSGTEAFEMFPVDTAQYKADATAQPAPGGVVSLVSPPNSMIMTPGGLHIYFGGTSAAAVYDVTANAISSYGFAGRPLGISPDGSLVIFGGEGDDAGRAFPVDAETGGITNGSGIPIPGVMAGAATPDGNTALFLAGNLLHHYRLNEGTSVRELGDIGFEGSEVVNLATGSLNYVVGTDGNIRVRATCVMNTADILTSRTIAAFTQPVALTPIPNGTGMLALETSGARDRINKITITTPAQNNGADTNPITGCPTESEPGFTHVGSSISLAGWNGTGSDAVQKLVVTPDSRYAIVLSDQSPTVAIIDLTAPEAVVQFVTLKTTHRPEGAPDITPVSIVAGGVDIAGASLYVAAVETDPTVADEANPSGFVNGVHRIDLTASPIADITPDLGPAIVNLTGTTEGVFVPANLVVVQPK